MNQPIQFITKINRGTITIPQEYSGDIQEELEVEVIIKPKPKQRLMDRLAQNPIQAEGWRNLTRQIHDRDKQGDTTVLNLQITKDQAFSLIDQLSPAEQDEILKHLLLKPWSNWLELTNDAPDKARQVASERGKNWDIMTEDEQENFIDELVHEA